MTERKYILPGEKTSSGRLILRLVLSFLSLMALRVRFEVGAGLETGNFLIDNLSKLPNQFYYEGIAELFIFAAIFWLLSFADSKDNRPEIWTFVLAFVFAVFYTIAMVCKNVGNFSFFFANLYQMALSALIVLGYTLLFYGLLRLVFHLFDESRACEEKPLRHPMRSAVIIMLLCWLPWLLMNYPCTICTDATGQIGQWLGSVPWSAHHPPFSSFIMGCCVSLGEFVWDRNFGAFLYVLLQAVSGAFIFSYVLSLLYKMGLSRRAWTLSLLFFVITPFWACYMQFFVKDVLYAESFVLALAFLLPVLKERRCGTKTAIVIATVALCAVLLRKTGLYELIPALLIAALWLKKADRLRLLAAAVSVIIVSSCVNNMLYPALGIGEASVREALSIPFQQTARYVNHFPDEVTAEERAAIDAVLVYDELDSYDPRVSDAVKSTYRENGDALPEYFRHWLSMLLKQPLCYFEAAFMLSYGYFAPVEVSLDAYILSEYFPYQTELGFYRVFGDFPTKAFDSVREMFIQFPLVNLLATAGLYTWILMVCFVQLLRKKNYPALIITVPFIMNVLICIASPLCSSTRYALPLIAAAPMLIGWVLINQKKTD